LKERVDEKKDEYGYQVLGMEVMPDHVHLLLDVDPRKGIHQIVGRIKGYTAPRIAQRVSLAEEPLAVSVDTAQVRIHSRQGEFRRGSEIP
jgi:REP element-mobilizing transposase RayT